MKQVLPFFFAFLPYPLFTQFLPPLDSILQKFDSIQAARCAAADAEFQHSKRGEWLKYLPSVGIGYTPGGSPRPTVALSLSTVYQITADRRDRQQRRAALEAACRYQSATSRAEITADFRQAASLAADIAEDERIFNQIDRQIFDFWTKKSDSQEILPIEYLEKLRQFEAARERIRRRHVELETIHQDIFSKSLW